MLQRWLGLLLNQRLARALLTIGTATVGVGMAIIALIVTVLG